VPDETSESSKMPVAPVKLEKKSLFDWEYDPDDVIKRLLAAPNSEGLPLPERKKKDK
jgi:hypothetical protein